MFAHAAGTVAKRLQLLKEAIPTLERLAFVPALTFRAGSVTVKDTGTPAKANGLELQTYWVQDPSNWSEPFAAMVTGRAGAVFVTESPSYIRHAKHIADLALENRMPTMFVLGACRSGWTHVLRAQPSAVFRRAAELVDKVLKGTKRPTYQSSSHEVRAGHQSEDSESMASPFPFAACTRGRGDPVAGRYGNARRCVHYRPLVHQGDPANDRSPQVHRSRGGRCRRDHGTANGQSPGRCGGSATCPTVTRPAGQP